MSLNIGLVGIGVMGSNLALNMSDHSINVKVYNKSEEKINTLINKDLNNNIEGYTSLKTLVENLEKPRTVMLLVPSGEATKTVIDDLTNLLDKDDLIIDAGNSYFLESSEMGNLCEKKGVKFIGMGVSGGEEGARNGPALMIGSKDPINETLQKILSSIAAKKDGVPCVGIYEGFGTGHFIKMLHNGIEYAEMQIIAEAYSVLRSSGFDNIKISNFFESFKEIGQSSYLIEITAEIFQKKNGDGFLIDQIRPLANHKGTGKLTVQTSLDYGYPLSAIYESLNARIESNFKNDWQQEELKMSEGLDLNKLQRAVYFSRFATLIQGLLFIQFFSTEHNLNIKISEVLKNWMGGCIIRSDLLSELTDFLNSDSKLEIIQIQNRLSNLVEDAKNIITGCISNNISTPVMSSTLNWYLNMSAEHNPSNLIQAQRDFFGAHTVQLLDSEEFLHLQWD